MEKRFTILKNILSLQIAQILTKIINVVFVAFAARHFGTEGFGQWSLVFLFLSFFGVLSDIGLDTLVVRDVARNPSESGKYLKNVIGIKLITSVVTSLMLIGFIRAAGYENEILTLSFIALPMLVFSTIAGTFVSVLKAHERMELTSGIEVVFGFMPSATGVVLLWLGAGMASILVAFVVWSGLRLVVLMWVVRKMVPVFRPEIDFTFYRKIMKDAVFFAILGLVMMLHIRIDFFMLSKLVGDAAVGIYAAPYRILEHIAMTGILINVAMQPTISALYVTSKERLLMVYRKMQKFFLIMALPVFTVLILYHREITLFTFGPQYEASARPLFILSWACALLVFTTPMRIVILQSNLLGRFAPVVTANLLLNIALNLLVIPRYSYVGAAWVSLSSSIIDLCIRVHFVRKVLGQKIDYWSMLPKPFAALGGMIACLLVLHSVWLPLRVLVSVIPYFYLLKWLGVYDREEIDKFIREPVARFLAHIRGRK